MGTVPKGRPYGESAVSMLWSEHVEKFSAAEIDTA